MENKQKKVAWWQPALEVGTQITGWIAAPIILALFIGRWLDKKYDSEPWLFLGSMLLAFIITSIGIARVTIGYIKKIEKEAEQNKLKKNNNSEN